MTLHIYFLSIFKTKYIVDKNGDCSKEEIIFWDSDREEAPVPKEYQDFMQHTHILVSNGLDRQLYKQEQVLKVTLHTA